MELLIQNECLIIALLDLLIISKVPTTTKGRKGLVWPLKTVQFILEMLNNGTGPSAVSPIIESWAHHSCMSVTIKELPSISFIRHCRGLLRIIAEKLAAYMIGKVDKWKRFFYDATSRRQINLTTLIIAIESKENIKPLIISSAHIGKSETAEGEKDNVRNVFENASARLAN